MHILNHQNFIETRRQSEECWGFGGSSSSNRTDSDEKISSSKGTLKTNFEKYAVTYPDGRVVTLHQDGRITETPVNGKEHSIRMPDRTFIS
jgi:hypothetical protein